jgi:hypothetical protein
MNYKTYYKVMAGERTHTSYWKDLPAAGRAMTYFFDSFLDACSARAPASMLVRE